MKEQTRKLITKVGWLLFVLYIILLFYFLFFSEYLNRGEMAAEYQVNLKLFNEIKRYIKHWRTLGVRCVLINIPGNIIAFMPLGFLLPILNNKYRRFILITSISLVFSLVIELTQYKTKVGSFDVDDILLNTLGGLLGYATYKVCTNVLYKIKNKRN